MDEVVLGACRGKWRLGGRIVAAQPANTGGRMEGAGHNVRRNQFESFSRGPRRFRQVALTSTGETVPSYRPCPFRQRLPCPAIVLWPAIVPLRHQDYDHARHRTSSRPARRQPGSEAADQSPVRRSFNQPSASSWLELPWTQVISNEHAVGVQDVSSDWLQEVALLVQRIT